MNAPIALLQQALDAYRHPLRHRRRGGGARHAPPEDIGDLLDLALAPPQALAECAARLHTDREELSEAVRFFLRQALLAEGGDAYRMLGLDPAATPGQIKARYRKLMRLFHPDRNTDQQWTDVYAPRINRAYAELRRLAPPLPGLEGGLKATPPHGACGLKPAPALMRPGSLLLAASCAAVATGLGFIAWNFSTWAEPPAQAPIPAAPSPPASPGGAPEDERRPPEDPEAQIHGLSERELQARVLDRLVAAYRKGDLDALMGLFAEHAVSNRQIGKEGIRHEYAEFFSQTTRRELRLGSFRWQIDGPTAIGKGTFRLKAHATKHRAGVGYEGILILDIGRDHEAPLIKGFFQSRRELP